MTKVFYFSSFESISNFRQGPSQTLTYSQYINLQICLLIRQSQKIRDPNKGRIHCTCSMASPNKLPNLMICNIAASVKVKR